MLLQNRLQKGAGGVAVAIVIGAVIIAFVLIFAGRSGEPRLSTSAPAHGGGSRSKQAFRLPNENDHTIGNPDAQIAIVEFSDFECPFCSRLHPTLETLVEARNDVKWVYRHFPITTSHSRAYGASVASECVAGLGGNDAFWEFTSELYSRQRELGPKLYIEVATDLGIDSSAFESCVNKPSDAIADRIQTDFDESVNSGARGTPFWVIVTPDSRVVSGGGAIGYAQLNDFINQAVGI